MPHDFTPDEAQYIANMIDAPVTLRRSQMPAHYQMGEACLQKLQAGMAPPAEKAPPPSADPPAGGPTPGGKPLAKDDPRLLGQMPKSEHGDSFSDPVDPPGDK